MHLSKSVFPALVLAAACLSAVGCGPTKGQLMLAKAMSVRVDRRPTYVASGRFLRGYLVGHSKDYVMWSMNYSSICMMGGNYDEAKAELLKCFMDIEKRQDTDKEKAAAASNESLKIFKGEPFERAMVCTYLGMLHYLEGDYNNARIFCARADMADATTEEDMKGYRHDFRLAHYWLGRTYLKMGDEGNARVAFGKAGRRIARKAEDRELKNIRSSQKKARLKRMRLEKECFKLATQQGKDKKPVAGVVDMSASLTVGELPDRLEGEVPESSPTSPIILGTDDREQFLAPDFQKQANLILVIETGRGPIKYLVGENQCMDRIIRCPYEERGVLVYLNGHKAGKAFQLLDAFHQADTRGMSEKDRLQLTKGIAQSILSRMPYIGNVAAYWNVQADHRYWHLMPGEVHVFAAKVKPGIYTIGLRCFDSNGCVLPRYHLTRYYMPVKAGMENIYFLHTKCEADNVYFPPEKK